MTTITLFEEGVYAGFSSFVGEDESYKISLESYMIERPKTTICVRVKGDSMKDAGIVQNDLALVDTSMIPKTGNIVIAILDGMYTIKFFEKDRKGIHFLRAANKSYTDIYPKEDLVIFGVVVGMIRKYS